jgi:hypothetical protein
LSITSITKTFHLSQTTEEVVDLHVREWNKNSISSKNLKEEIENCFPGETLILQEGNSLHETYIITVSSPGENSFLFFLRADDESLRSLNSNIKRSNKARKNKILSNLEALNKFRNEGINEWYWYVQSIFKEGRFSPSTILVSGSLREAIVQSRFSTEATVAKLFEVSSLIGGFGVQRQEPRTIFEVRQSCLNAFSDCFELHVNDDTFKPSFLDQQRRKRYIPEEDMELPADDLVEFESFSHQMKGGFSFSVFCGKSLNSQINKSYYMTASFDRSFTAVGMAAGPIMAARRTLNQNLSKGAFENNFTLDAAGDSFWETIDNLKHQIISCLTDVIMETGFLYGTT